jgi:lysophospholipase L1-like esterase
MRRKATNLSLFRTFFIVVLMFATMYAAVNRSGSRNIAKAAEAMSTATASSSPPRNKKIDREIRIFCFGDSLTAGTSPPSLETYPYAPYLEASLKTRGVLPNAVVRHRGFPGWTASQLLDSVNSEQGLLTSIRKIQDPPLSIVIILAGTNDLGYQREDVEISSDLFRLHEACYAEGIAHTIGISIPSSNYQVHYAEAAKKAEKVNTLLEEFCLSKPEGQATFHRFPFGYDGGDNWSHDGLHFSEDGYKILAESLAPVIEDILIREEEA